MISISGHCTLEECHLTPSFILRDVPAKELRRGEVAAFQFIIHWLFWAGMITWAREAGK